MKSPKKTIYSLFRKKLTMGANIVFFGKVFFDYFYTSLEDSKKCLPKKTILAPLATFFRKRLYIVFFGKSKTFPKKTMRETYETWAATFVAYFLVLLKQAFKH